VLVPDPDPNNKIKLVKHKGTSVFKNAFEKVLEKNNSRNFIGEVCSARCGNVQVDVRRGRAQHQFVFFRAENGRCFLPWKKHTTQFISSCVLS
jgi:hypothetical protein